ncbi:unnamed protein product [Gulo gulo]|uniref:Uncharacterized protein n=1 Tax=Gulo gulo TaxID=48420 RepID=A0A9X9LS93_GULGU|nr:unnamed protein product [Gulo gulo]
MVIAPFSMPAVSRTTSLRRCSMMERREI